MNKTAFQPEELGMSSLILNKLIMENAEEIKKLKKAEYNRIYREITEIKLINKRKNTI